MGLKSAIPILAVLGFWLSPACFSQEPSKIKKWEYAELIAWYPGPTALGEDIVQFSVGKTNIKCDRWSDLGKKFGVKEKEVNALVMIDHLGSQAWELTSAMSISTPGCVELRWYFKRQKQ